MLDHRLQLFIKVAETGSITDTANELFVSQPAVSKQIKSLEDELNVKLFHRDKRSGLILTDIGEKILSLAKQAAYIDNRMYQAAFRENNFIGGKLKIASLPILSTTLLAQALPIFREKYPHVKVEITEGSPLEVQQLVREHSVDFGLSCSPFEELDHSILIHDSLIGLFPADTENVPEQIDLNDGTDNLIFCCAGAETVLKDLYSKHNISFANALIFQSEETVMNMVQNKNGIGILSWFTMKAVPNPLKMCKVIPHTTFEIGVEAVSLSDLTPVAERFYSILKQVSEQYL